MPLPLTLETPAFGRRRLSDRRSGGPAPMPHERRIGTEWQPAAIDKWREQVVPPPEQLPPPDPRELPPEPLSPVEITAWRDSVIGARKRPGRGGTRDVLDWVRWDAERRHEAAEELPTLGMRARWQGNETFASGGFATSVAMYGDGVKAVRLQANDAHLEHLFYANRSAAHLPLRNFALALSDAQKALDLRPQHVLAHLRRALALLGLGRSDDAAEGVFECARQCAADLTDSQWTYLAFILHKALPLSDDPTEMAARLSDRRLGLVPSFLIACLYHTYNILSIDTPEDDVGTSVESEDGAAVSASSSPAALRRLTADKLQRRGGCQKQSEHTSMGPRSGSRTSEAGDAAPRKRLLEFVVAGGREAVATWRRERSPKAICLAQLITRMLNQFVPPATVAVMERRERELSRPCGSPRMPPSEATPESPQPGDDAEALRGGEWEPAELLSVSLVGAVRVRWADGDTALLSEAEVRRRPVTQSPHRGKTPRAGQSPKSRMDDARQAAQLAAAEALASGEWEEKEDRDGRVFYYNQMTKKTTRDLGNELLRNRQVKAREYSRNAAAAMLASYLGENGEVTGTSFAGAAVSSVASDDNIGEMVEEALERGEWICKRNALTGRQYYYHPQTKLACTDLRDEFAKRLAAAAEEEFRVYEQAIAVASSVGESDSTPHVRGLALTMPTRDDSESVASPDAFSDSGCEKEDSDAVFEPSRPAEPTDPLPDPPSRRLAVAVCTRAAAVAGAVTVAATPPPAAEVIREEEEESDEEEVADRDGGTPSVKPLFDDVEEPEAQPSTRTPTPSDRTAPTPQPDAADDPRAVITLADGGALVVSAARAPDGSRSLGKVAVQGPDGAAWLATSLSYDDDIRGLRMQPAAGAPAAPWLLSQQGLRESLAALRAVAVAAGARHLLTEPATAPPSRGVSASDAGSAEPLRVSMSQLSQLHTDPSSHGSVPRSDATRPPGQGP